MNHRADSRIATLARFGLCAVGGLIVLPAASAVAQPDKATNPTAIEFARDAIDPQQLARLIAELDAPEFERRALAYDTLASTPSVLTRDYEAILAERGDALSAEQRSSLLELARRSFYRDDRAGLGVEFSRTQTGVGVPITRTVPGFPAAETLQPGDVLLLFDGVPLSDTQGMRSAIISRDPGDKVGVVITRGGQEMELDLQLGRFSDLRQGAELDAESLAQAWDRRLARAEFKAVRGPIHDARDTPGLPLPRIAQQVPEWPQVRGRSSTDVAAWLTGRDGDPRPLTAGGRWRAGLDRFGLLRVNVLGEDIGLPPVPSARQALAAGNRQGQIQSAISVIDEELVTLRQRLGQLENARQSSLLSEEQRLATTAELLEVRREVGRLDAQRRALWAIWDIVPRR